MVECAANLSHILPGFYGSALNVSGVDSIIATGVPGTCSWLGKSNTLSKIEAHLKLQPFTWGGGNKNFS